MRWQGSVTDWRSKFSLLAGNISCEDKQSFLVASGWKKIFFLAFVPFFFSFYVEKIQHILKSIHITKKMIKLITTLVTEVMAQLMTGPIVRMEPAATEKILNTNATIGIQRLLVRAFSLFPLFDCFFVVVVVLSSLFSYPDPSLRKGPDCEAFVFIQWLTCVTLPASIAWNLNLCCLSSDRSSKTTENKAQERTR